MGPFWSHFHQSWVQADQAMRALHPGLDASFLAADTYYTKAMQEVKSELTSMNRYDILGRINALRVERVNNLEAIANTVTIAATKGQTIDEGLLNTPPFYYQGDMTNEYSKYSADDTEGKAERTIPKIDFVQRWARGLNQAMFVIA